MIVEEESSEFLSENDTVKDTKATKSIRQTVPTILRTPEKNVTVIHYYSLVLEVINVYLSY